MASHCIARGRSPPNGSTYPKTSETYPNDHLLPSVVRQSRPSDSVRGLRSCAFRHPHFGPFLRMERRFSPFHPQFAPFLRMGQSRLRHARLTTFRLSSCPAPTAFRLPSCPAPTGHPVVVGLRSSGVLPRSQKKCSLGKTPSAAVPFAIFV